MWELGLVMARHEDIEMQLAELDIDGEENEQLVVEEGVDETVNKFELCLIGRFLTETIVER